MDQEVRPNQSHPRRYYVPHSFISFVEERKRKGDDGASNRNNTQSYEKKLVTDADRTAWATIVIAIAALLSFGAAILQYAVLSGQLREMKSAAAQTDKLVAAAADQASAAKIAAETARQNMIAGQRAWVGPRNASFVGEPAIGKPIEITIEAGAIQRPPSFIS
jgi:hypothetical protein